MVALGSNDFINNYLMPVYSDSWKYNDEGFVSYLTETLQTQLQVIPIIEARNFISPVRVFSAVVLNFLAVAA